MSPAQIASTQANPSKEHYEWTEENYTLSTSTTTKESFYQKLFFKGAT